MSYQKKKKIKMQSKKHSFIEQLVSTVKAKWFLSIYGNEINFREM